MQWPAVAAGESQPLFSSEAPARLHFLEEASVSFCTCGDKHLEPRRGKKTTTTTALHCNTVTSRERSARASARTRRVRLSLSLSLTNGRGAPNPRNGFPSHFARNRTRPSNALTTEKKKNTRPATRHSTCTKVPVLEDSLGSVPLLVGSAFPGRSRSASPRIPELERVAVG